jgi:lipopolysaccharide biosynthesis glycosyltransferase
MPIWCAGHKLGERLKACTIPFENGFENGFEMQGSEIVIAFGLDAGYAAHAGAAIASIVAAAPQRVYRFVMLHDGVPADLQAQVQMCAPGARFDWLSPPEDLLACNQVYGHVSRATYARFAIPDLLQDCARVLYLDCDVIVLADLAPLFASDLQGAALGAVIDHWIDPLAFAEAWGLDRASARYFNAGILMLDLDVLRREGGFARALETLNTQGSRLPYMDQDALNQAFWGRWHQLDRVWNVQRAAVMRGFEAAAQARDGLETRRPKIVHYTGREKPWRRGTYHPYAGAYLQALARTPFWDKVLAAGGPVWHERMRARWDWARKALSFPS